MGGGWRWSLCQASSCVMDFTHINVSIAASLCIEQRAKEPLLSARSRGSPFCHSCHLPSLHVVHGWANTPPWSFSTLSITGMQLLCSSTPPVSGYNIFMTGMPTNTKKTQNCQQESWLKRTESEDISDKSSNGPALSVLVSDKCSIFATWHTKSGYYLSWQKPKATPFIFKITDIKRANKKFATSASPEGKKCAD